MRSIRRTLAVAGVAACLSSGAPADAQVYSTPAEVPQVTAAGAQWRVNGEPIVDDGIFYYPTGPTIFFDGQTMTRTGVYRGVPLYQDRTLEPYSVMFVPVG